ncbi:MAG: hypothetical protein KDD44_06155, partial [Bdellovibrionales bacterium]|nr:hypothetical protein [Bdellovibrionales bacterium]
AQTSQTKRTTTPAGPFFWVWGPLLLVLLSMFVANPQCVIYRELPCSQNWTLHDGILSVWSVQFYWSTLARISAATSLAVVWLILLYHLFTIARRRAGRSRHFTMGVANGLLLPGALFIVTKPILEDNNLYQVQQVSLDDYGVFRLYRFRNHHELTYAIGKELASEPWKTTSELIGLVDSFRPENARYMVRPGNLQPGTSTPNDAAELLAVPQQGLLALVYGGHSLLYARRLTNADGPSPLDLDQTSPFLLFDSTAEIPNSEAGRILRLAERAAGAPALRQSIGLPKFDTLSAEIDHPNPAVRALTLRLLATYPESHLQAAALFRLVAHSDANAGVRSAARALLDPAEDSAGSAATAETDINR